MTVPVAISRVIPWGDVGPVSKRIGLVLLATDHTTERDFNRMVPSDRVAVYGTRVEYANPTTPDNLRLMAPKLTAATTLLLPDETLDTVVFACTTASVVIGDMVVTAAINKAKPGARIVTPVSAARDALRRLNARRISILTPYTLETSRPLVECFVGLGFEVLNLDCFGLEDDRQMAGVALECIVEAARSAVHADADALFISCTALRSAQVAGRIESVIGRPVVTSNQASVWQALRHCGIDSMIEGYGRLFAMGRRRPHYCDGPRGEDQESAELRWKQRRSDLR